MEDKYALITTLVAAIVLAFVFGFIASRLRLSPIVGYLVAGLAVGPYTPGFTGFNAGPTARSRASAPPRRGA